MNRNRVDRRKQIVPSRAQRAHRFAVQAAKESRGREKAASFIQQFYKSRLKRPHVFTGMKGKELVFRDIQPDYASYGLLRDFLRNRGEATLTNDEMQYFQKVYTPDDRYGEFVLKVPFPDWFAPFSGVFDDPNDPLRV